MAMKQICTSCGKGMNKDYGLSFGYIMKDLRLSQAESDRLRDLETNTTLINKKKLILVLDLDETLIHFIGSNNLRPNISIEDVYEVEFENVTGFVKLRPFVHKFLEEVSTMFEMYIYTNAVEVYARKMVNLLDPENKYFNSRIIARENSTVIGVKNLDVVLGQERAIVILDDKKKVWPMHNDNLIEVQNFKYFGKEGSGRKDKGILENCYLKILKKIHSEFFNPKVEINVSKRDVRKVMEKIRIKILKGCKIVLSHSLAAERKESLLKMAEKMGAICVTEIDSAVTHVITDYNKVDEEIQWAKEKEGNNLVKPTWIRHCYVLWKKQSAKYYTRHALNI